MEIVKKPLIQVYETEDEEVEVLVDKDCHTGHALLTLGILGRAIMKAENGFNKAELIRFFAHELKEEENADIG